MARLTPTLILFAAMTLSPLAALADADLVNMADYAPAIVQDIRYATTDNFTHRVLYPVGKCYLLKDVAKRLKAVQEDLEKEGLGLKVFDCYRPFSVQERLWAVVPDERFVGKPVRENGKPVQGSRHNRGAAVDLTLIDGKGRELEMPSAFDEFTERASRGYQGGSEASRANRARLEAVMVAHGFEPLPTEWWHFDAAGWQNYPLLDLPID